MLFNLFNTRKAVEVGTALADQLVTHSNAMPAPPRKKDQAGNPLQIFLQQIDRDARPLQLGIYGRSKLAHSFKWRLLEKGVAPERADELTNMLVMRLSAAQSPTAQPSMAATPAGRRGNRRQADALFAEADACLQNGAFARAADVYARALALNPRHAIARNRLGAALCRLGRYEAAREQFRRAVTLDPRLVEAQSNLGSVLLWTGRTAEAEAPLRRALKLSPSHVDAQVALGRTLYALGRLRDSRDAYEKALKLAPSNVYALVGLGQIAASGGRFDEAEALFRRASESEPKVPVAWAGLAAYRKMTSADAAWLATAEKIAEGNFEPLDEAAIRFAIGKYHDDVGDFKRAFRSYQRANELQKMAAESYDREQRSSFVNDMIRLYTRESCAREQAGGSNSARPVFVVGMMRSGTSLIEQIIASHPLAAGAGELAFWSTAAHGGRIDAQGSSLTAQARQQLSEAYLEILARHSSAAQRVVDKTNINSDYLGVIHAVFPNARMIYVQRDPVDTCLSCYFQQFSTALNFTMDLSDLAHYYREHHRLVSHWRAVLPPGTLLDVPYEALVAEQEKWTRKIIDFIGLEWDPRCLRFEQTERAVLTASQWQVRQKIYRSSLERWRNYEKYIGPLLGLRDLQA